jgi:hypothetical protein
MGRLSGDNCPPACVVSIGIFKSRKAASRGRYAALTTHDIFSRRANPIEETYCRFSRLVKWIKEHKFAKAQKEGWFDALRYQSRLHARHARVTDCWHDWEEQWENHPAAQYPAFKKWHTAADRYTFELGNK